MSKSTKSTNTKNNVVKSSKVKSTPFEFASKLLKSAKLDYEQVKSRAERQGIAMTPIAYGRAKQLHHPKPRPAMTAPVERRVVFAADSPGPVSRAQAVSACFDVYDMMAGLNAPADVKQAVRKFAVWLAGIAT